MNTNIDIFTTGDELQIKLNMSFDKTIGQYPVLKIRSGADSLNIYPSLEQLKQLNLELTKFIIANEPQEQTAYLHCISDLALSDFTVGKDYPVISEDTEKGIYAIRDNVGDLRYMELRLWPNHFEWIEK